MFAYQDKTEVLPESEALKTGLTTRIWFVFPWLRKNGARLSSKSDELVASWHIFTTICSQRYSRFLDRRHPLRSSWNGLDVPRSPTIAGSARVPYNISTSQRDKTGVYKDSKIQVIPFQHSFGSMSTAQILDELARWKKKKFRPIELSLTRAVESLSTSSPLI